MLAKEFKVAKGTRYTFISFAIMGALIILIILPIFLEEFKYRSLFSIGALLIPIIFPTLAMTRKYSVNRKYFYIHYLIGWKKMKIENLIAVQQMPGVVDNDFSLEKLFKTQNPFFHVGKQEHPQIGPYKSYVTDPKKFILLRFKEQKIAISPQYPERFIGYMRNYINN